LRVDGGMVVNNWFLQFLSDILNLEVQRPASIETSALGVAYLAGLQIGMYQSLDEIGKLWKADATFFPTMSTEQREKLYAGWQRAVRRVEEPV
jgi:glycerol kinase